MDAFLICLTPHAKMVSKTTTNATRFKLLNFGQLKYGQLMKKNPTLYSIFLKIKFMMNHVTKHINTKSGSLLLNSFQKIKQKKPTSTSCYENLPTTTLSCFELFIQSIILETKLHVKRKNRNLYLKFNPDKKSFNDDS